MIDENLDCLKLIAGPVTILVTVANARRLYLDLRNALNDLPQDAPVVEAESKPQVNFQHMPLPWKLDFNDGKHEIVNKFGNYVGSFYRAIDAIAAVESANSHAHLVESNRRLVEACESMIEWVRAGCDPTQASVRKGIDAIAFSKGQP